ncbi:MAG TPA: response regulator [Candidatus Dormibacteraeota bacterium]|nr:response regulator [Candidatus Dormibacteraeota bacterium]
MSTPQPDLPGNQRYDETEAFRALYEVAVASSGVLEPSKLASLLVTRLANLIDHPSLSAMLYWWRADAGILEGLASSDGREEKPIKPGEGVNGICFESGEALLLDDYASWDQALPWAVQRGTKSVAGFPLKINDRVIGVLGIRVLHSPLHFDDRIQRLASLMAALVGPALEAAELHARLEAAGTELNRKNEELERASRHKSEFLANMSHELRTPLSAIIGFADLLLDGADGDLSPDQFEDVSQIQVSGRHLLGLINDILDLSKIEAGRMTLELEVITIEPIVNQIVAALQPLAESKKLALVADLQAGSDQLVADPTRVRQVLTNLVSNAIKFTAEGSVTIRCERLDHELEISVTDTGIGIPTESIDRIFEEFVQADSSTSRRYGGTGLGLSISRRLIEMQGGSLGVDSALGEGSKFWFRLPVGPKSQTPSGSPEAILGAHFNGWRSQTHDLVLCIDDEESTRRVIVRRLQEADYQTVEASGAEEGLKLAKELHPAAITLDIMMPAMDGWTVLASLKADPLTKDIPVVIVSIVDGKEMAVELGASGYLAKPFTAKELVGSLRRVLPTLAGTSILCVDDEAAARTLLTRGLRQSKASVRVVESAAEAVLEIQREMPDAVVCDLTMPGMTGFELIGWIRQQPHLALMPVIVVSNRELSDEEIESLQGRIDRFIWKPDLRPGDLPATVRQAIGHLTTRPPIRTSIPAERMP